MAGKQLNFRVPEGDPSREWIDAQDNLSTSLKLLIRRVMAHTGPIDFPGALADGLLDSMFESPVAIVDVEPVKKQKVRRKVKSKQADQHEPKSVQQSIEETTISVENNPAPSVDESVTLSEVETKPESVVESNVPEVPKIRESSNTMMSMSEPDDISSFILGSGSNNGPSNLLDELIAKSNEEDN